MAYQYNDGLEYDPQDDPDHDWVHVGYIENNSPDRPPTLNRDNFPSSEGGRPVNDPNTAPQVQALSMNMNNIYLAEDAPSSYPSSSDGSLRAPDGPERSDPPNKFIQVAPAPGLGEVQHRRRASFDEVEDQLTYSLRRWARTLPPTEPSFHASFEGMQGGWLPLDTHIVGPTDSVRATRGKSSGSASVLLSSVYSGASSGWRSSNMDPLNEMGAWIVDSVNGGWPMEIDEEAIEDNGH
jgi:hypothetical protein